jgi:hypothetical protein
METLAIVSAGRGAMKRIEEWHAVEAANLTTYVALGCCDLVVIEPQGKPPEVHQSITKLFRWIDLDVGSRGEGLDGVTRAYACALRPDPQFAQSPPHADRLATLVLVSGAKALEKNCPALAEVARGSGLRLSVWSTEGFYRWCCLVEADFPAAYEKLIAPFRALGVATYSIPLIPWQIARGEAFLPVENEQRREIHIAASAIPGLERQAADELTACLGSAFEFRVSHGYEDLFLRGDGRVSLAELTAKLWNLRRSPNSPIWRTYTSVSAPLVPLSGAWERGPEENAPASPFAVPDLAGGWDFSQQMRELRHLRGKVVEARKHALPRFEQVELSLGVTDIELRVRRGSSSSPTLVTLQEGRDESIRTVNEVLLSYEQLKNKERAELLALQELTCAALADILVALQRVLEAPVREGRSLEYGAPGRDIAYDVYRTVGEMVAMAVLTTWKNLPTEQFVPLVFGGQAAETLRREQTKRLVGVGFAAEQIQKPSSVPLDWIRSIDGARDAILKAVFREKTAAATWLEGRIPFELARDVLFGSVKGEGMGPDERLRYCQAVAVAWGVGLRLGRCILESLRGGRRREEPVEASNIAQDRDYFHLFRTLLIADNNFRHLASEVAAMASHEPEVSNLLRKMKDYADAMFDLENDAAADGQVPSARTCVQWRVLKDRQITELPSGVSLDKARRFSDLEHEIGVAQQLARAGAHGANPGLILHEFYPAVRYERFYACKEQEEGEDDGAYSNMGYELLASFQGGPVDRGALARARLPIGSRPLTVMLDRVQDRLSFIPLIESYVGLERDEPPAESAHTAILRRMSLELWCLEGVRDWLANSDTLSLGDRLQDRIVSLNVTPWLLIDEVGNPWHQEFAQQISDLMGSLCREIVRKGAKPVIEIVEGRLPGCETVAEAKSWEMLWDFLHRVRGSDREAVGIAIHDQSGPGTDIRRLHRIVTDAQRAAFKPIIVKLDHHAVRSALGATSMERPSREHWIAALFALGEAALVACGMDQTTLEYLVFEGFGGWGPGSADEHRRALQGAMNVVRRRSERWPTVLFQGEPLFS